MGFFDFIGDAIGAITDPITSILKPITGFLGSTKPGLDMYNQFAGASNSADAIEAQVQGQRETNAMNAAQAQLNRDFTERLSSSAHQREVADLKAAGLNPILSGMGGSGASTPAGSMATMVNPFGGVAEATNSARRINEIEQSRVYNENKLREENLKNIQANTDLTEEKQKTEKESQLNLRNSGFQAYSSGKLNETKLDTEAMQQKALLSQSLENMSRVNLNSANTANSQAENRLKNYDINEREYLQQTKKWTGPVQEILKTGQPVIDGIINSKRAFSPIKPQ
ncbi:MAG: DNA pilot protein [Microvirus sp.]|nr:MAG: DNA pilot protein [Microvirus sp.]